jgi:hypothetical protein
LRKLEQTDYEEDETDRDENLHDAEEIGQWPSQDDGDERYADWKR